MPIPLHGKPKDVVLQEVESFAARDLPWRAGRTFAYIYDAGPEVEEVAKAAYMRYLTENALDPTVYPSLLRFENELVEMARAHLSGDDKVVGNFTSGGTESCLLAVKTARDFARATKPHIKAPEVILPVTAHAAFHKACDYFCVKPVLVPVDSETFRAVPAAIEKAITPNTIQIVASAVSYAHGVLDPIEEIAAIARAHDLLLHVDGCIGGFFLPYWRRLGRHVPPFDFSVPGVTSMSMDLHKYAYCPKGASVILHRTKELRKYQIYACAHWTGYSIINPTIQSSKTGGPLAAAWAVMNFLGEDGYLRIAERTLKATDEILQGLKTIPELKVLGTPDLCLIAFTSDEMSVFPLVDEMRRREWYIQPQLGFMGSRENIHLSVGQKSIETAGAMIRDLKEAVAAVKARGIRAVPPEARDVIRGLNADTLTLEAFQKLVQMSKPHLGGTTTVNEILNLMDPAVAKKAMTEYMNELYIPKPSAG